MRPTPFSGPRSTQPDECYSFDEVRFYAISSNASGGVVSNNGRVIHFKTVHPGTVSYFKTGVGSTAGIATNYTPLTGHTSFLPASITNTVSNQGNLAMTEYPLWTANQYHWYLAGTAPCTGRWEADDYVCTPPSTFHQIWVRQTIVSVTSITVNSPTICEGQTANLIANGGTNYTWSSGATPTGGNTADASPVLTTTYTVTGNNNGCVDSAQSIVFVNPSPTITVNAPDICPGKTAHLTGYGGISYTWSTGIDSTGTNTADAAPSTTTTYTVTGTDNNGCSDSATFLVTVNPLPTMSFTTTSDGCSVVAFSNTSTGASAYFWISAMAALLQFQTQHISIITRENIPFS